MRGIVEAYRGLQKKKEAKRRKVESQVRRALWILHSSGNEEALADSVREQIRQEDPTRKAPSKRAVDNALNDKRVVDSRPRAPHSLDRRTVTVFRLKSSIHPGASVKR